MLFEHMAENQQVQHRRHNRRGQRLRRNFPETQYFLVKQSLEADHFSPSMIWMNTSSRSACCNCMFSITASDARNLASIGSTSEYSLTRSVYLLPDTSSSGCDTSGFSASGRVPFARHTTSCEPEIRLIKAEVESSATTLPALSIAMRLHNASASSR